MGGGEAAPSALGPAKIRIAAWSHPIESLSGSVDHLIKDQYENSDGTVEVRTMVHGRQGGGVLRWSAQGIVIAQGVFRHPRGLVGPGQVIRRPDQARVYRGAASAHWPMARGQRSPLLVGADFERVATGRDRL